MIPTSSSWELQSGSEFSFWPHTCLCSTDSSSPPLPVPVGSMSLSRTQDFKCVFGQEFRDVHHMQFQNYGGVGWVAA